MNYPAAIKAFYMKPVPGNPERVLCADLLAPEGYGEIIGGSMREEDYDALVTKMDELGMDRTEYEFYLDLRKYGYSTTRRIWYRYRNVVTSRGTNVPSYPIPTEAHKTIVTWSPEVTVWRIP